MNFNTYLEQGSAHAWLYLPIAVVLGALHGLEPGHSKTMMAAFIIAVRGTIFQATLLGLAAAVSHSLVIWALAAIALKFGSQWNVETTAPYFLIATGAIVAGMALWTIWRLRRGHSHHHHDEEKRLPLPYGDLTLSIFEESSPPRFRIVGPDSVVVSQLRTVRADGSTQSFTFHKRILYWESNEEIPEPHQFRVELEVNGPSGESTLSAEFTEHAHDDDAHAREHADQIRRRFADRPVTTSQIVIFGLTGGLMPCPAALSILLICLQLKQFTLGFSLVAGFSIGLALTLVAVGVGAAWGMRQVAKRSGSWERLAHKAPYFSSVVLIVLGVSFVGRGVWQLS